MLPPVSPSVNFAISCLTHDLMLKPFYSSINTFLHERLYDFTGSSTFVACTIYSLVSSHPDIMQRMNSLTWASFHSNPFFRNLIVTAAVVAWAVRFKPSFVFVHTVRCATVFFHVFVDVEKLLHPPDMLSGSDHFFFSASFKLVETLVHFVFCKLHNILQVGKDDRFDLVRDNKFRFFTFWHIQGLWVFITLMPVHVCNFFRGEPPAWNAVDWSGLAFWTTGFAVEVIADHQKSMFRKKNGHTKDPKWICSGLWA